MSILLATDEIIHELNRQYRAIDEPTDVLAFPMQEGEYGEINPYLLGDVVISTETAQRQASLAGHKVEQEIAVLLIHGLLHLAGYDHEEEKTAKVMEERTNELLQIIHQDITNECYLP